MTVRRHKQDTRTFAELTYDEQAKSITATVNNLQRAIIHHIEHAPSSKRREVRDKCVSQVHRFLGRLIART